jgi:hypothetical protein
MTDSKDVEDTMSLALLEALIYPRLRDKVGAAIDIVFGWDDLGI